MIGERTVLALIPARGGSKGIPGKNLANLAGKPLLAWTIEAALGASLVDRVVLTSDADDIIAVARSLGCEIPFRRPAELAADDTPGMDPVLHALQALSGVDIVVLLQPTSPLRTSADIDAALRLYADSGAPAVIGVTAVTKPLEWTYLLDDAGAMRPLLGETTVVQQRQQGLPAVSINGAMYIAGANWLAESGTFMVADTVAYEMPAERSVDIDSDLDLKLAEVLLSTS